MTIRHYSGVAAGVLGSLVTIVFVLMTSIGAQAQSQYPIMDGVAAKVIQKYQNSTCEQLLEKRNSNAPPTMEETRVLTLLRDDANMRAAFIKIVAPPIASKLFDCGMIP
jgi:ABC-type phosphate/phosphonate transport system permease subunit